MAQATAVTERNGLAYGPLPAEVGDLYLPSSPSAGRPAVLLIHGGGWVIGGRASYTGIARAAAERGMVAFSIDYRLAQAADPQTHWPAQLIDAQLAVRFLRAHAKEFGLDPARVGAMGDSAGGHLAVFLGALQAVEPGDAAGLYPSEPSTVAAVIDQFGPMIVQGSNPSAVGSITALFGTPNPPPAQLAAMSPLPDVSPRSAPVYILHGTKDALVPFHDSEQLAAKLIAAGVQTVFVPFYGGHAYEGLPPETILQLQFAALDWLKLQLQK